ncbi:hypothetical protein COO60DRAFT_1113854 [Scenedesmus sp. NREL 46B-D3]|nr:hypothetical protein COO60DRAFT_1113854 [Scenedesmus sp. NREL 46B-D3]
MLQLMLKPTTYVADLRLHSACRRSICRHAALGACAVLQQPAAAAAAAAMQQQQHFAAVEQCSDAAARDSVSRPHAPTAPGRPVLERHQPQSQEHWRPEQQQQQPQHLQQLLWPPQRQIKCRSWSKHHALLLRTLRQQPNLLPKGCSVLLAVSGGQDSMALLRLLLDVQQQWPLQLSVAHCDHRMRPDAAANAAFVRQQVQQLGLDYREAVAEQQLKSENDAREWRHQQLQRLAQAAGCSHIALGHTATDKAETLLLNLMRWVGLRAVHQ